MWRGNCLSSFTFWKSRNCQDYQEEHKSENNSCYWRWSKRCVYASRSSYWNRNYREWRNVGSSKFRLCNSWIFQSLEFAFCSWKKHLLKNYLFHPLLLFQKYLNDIVLILLCISSKVFRNERFWWSVCCRLQHSLH